MTYVAGSVQDYTSFDPDHFSHRVSSRVILASGCFTLACLVAAWMLDSHPPEASQPQVVATTTAAPTSDPAYTYLPLLDPGFSLGADAGSFDQGSPLVSSFVSNQPPVPAPVQEANANLDAPADLDAPAPADNGLALPAPAPSPLVDVPVPAPRPAELAAGGPQPPLPSHPTPAQTAQQKVVAAATGAPADHRSFFEKIFGSAISASPSSQVLAYASPEDGLVRRQSAIPAPIKRYDRWTAVYDISAHIVYMPDGTQLEAHSGLRERLDDPRYVSERMRGPTPPAIYELTPREQLFHGVQALRLNPVGGDVYGRTGLLAHTYMLGPNGDSNGCVSFRDYNAFLHAYSTGEVKRLVVVARLSP